MVKDIDSNSKWPKIDEITKKNIGLFFRILDWVKSEEFKTLDSKSL